MKYTTTNIWYALLLSVLLAACGGGGGGSMQSLPASQTYSVGGTVTGLTGILVLGNNGGDNLAVSANTTYTFATELADGEAYNVSVISSPTLQTCSVSNASGNIAGADVTNISVVCTDVPPPVGAQTYSVGGSVSGLTAGGLVLSNNGSDSLAVNADGNFTFSTAIADGDPYLVSVAVAPTLQTCTVSNAGGNIAGANVVDIVIDCVDSVQGSVGGTLDLQFNSPSGYIATELGSNSKDEARAMAIQADGRIILAGRQDNNISLVRYNSNGTLDTTFGPGGTGIVTAALMSSNVAYAIVIQPADGKIIVAGSTYNTTTLNRDFALVRLDVDGNIDTSFGPDGDGKVSTDFSSRDDYAYAIALDSQGRIVVAGKSVDTTTNVGDVALARYDSAGNLDASFSVDGKVRTNMVRSTGIDDDDGANALVIAAGDKPVIAGFSGNIDSVNLVSSYDFLVIQYGSDGTRDNNFGPNGNGIVFIDFNGGTDRANAMVADSSGNLIVAGQAFDGPLLGGTNDDFAIARFNATGVLDTTGFGTGGKSTQDFGVELNEVANGLSIQSDGKFIVVGSATDPISHSHNLFGYLRFDSNGHLDTSFGTVALDIGGGAQELHAVVVQPDGKILGAGFMAVGTDFEFAAMRINP